jgi:hypothetical protein
MNITTIIPIHEINEKVLTYLEKALESIVKQEGIEEKPSIILVYDKNLDAELKVFMKKYLESGLNILFVKNDGNTDYQSQVNLAVDSVTTDYFSVLEFDDEYGLTFFKNAIKYVEIYSEIDVFLSMMIEVNERNEGIKLTNETVWAQQFVGENGEMGYLNINALKQYTDFKLSGAIIKTTEFKNLGKYKSNIKLAFMYEFLLRALNNASKIYTIPKIGYKHLATREDSLFNIYLKTMSLQERKFWFETATNEANFMNDRVIDMSRLTKLTISEK